MNFRTRKIIEGSNGALQSLPLGCGCMALWRPSGPIYAFNGINQKVSEIPRPASYIYALGRGADQTILIPTIRGLVYRYNMDGHLVETVTLENPMHLLAVTQLPDYRYLACMGDRHFGLDVTPSFVLFDRSGKFEQLVMQRQSYDPEFEVLPWGDVLVTDDGQLIRTVEIPTVEDLGPGVIWRRPIGPDPHQAIYFALHQGPEIAFYSKAGKMMAKHAVAIERARQIFVTQDNCVAILDQKLQVHKFDLYTLSESGVQRLSLGAFESSTDDVAHFDYRSMPELYPSLFPLGTDQYLCVTGTQPVVSILNSAFEQVEIVRLFEGGTLDSICQLDSEKFIALDNSGQAALVEFS